MNFYSGRCAAVLSVLLLVQFAMPARAARTAHQPEYSTAGFFELPQTGRSVYSMNPAWRIHVGEAQGAEQVGFDDSDWRLVSLPDGMEVLPTEASGCVNYQGEVWYRKHFTPDEAWVDKQLFLHFEAIMGKSRVWVNGELVQEHFGGYLPVIADLTGRLKPGEDNVIAVWADNSDDPAYPPGKPQDVLDFTYFGGIYRDCWLIAHNDVFITDPNFENVTAGGGLFVSFGKVSEAEAEVRLDLHVRNRSPKNFSGKVLFELYDKEQRLVRQVSRPLSVARGSARSTTARIEVERPFLWEPDAPYLYQLHVKVLDRNGKVIDGYRRRVGIRSVEFRGKDGFWLNGKPYPYPMIGANRHQDFAVVGNALSNSLHWRDAKKLRDAGMRVIRNAHYPQDPAFMDACDELGLFVIVNTPGWQFWNNEPIFAQRVYDDIRNMVRRDRNHPCVWLWEPILNETWYPEEFARQALDIVHAEYPYPYCYAGCDASALGHELFPVQFTHPLNGGGGAYSTNSINPEVAYFTREWGDNVDDWYSHNSPSRVNRAWGEVPMLVQAQGYARTDYVLTNYDVLWRNPRQFMGGCLWHSFDHQRGYHPDPFYGGIMDAFRQPKYSYYMFCSQRPAEVNEALIAESGPVVYIAHAMTPFSPKDITVYSNCDQVRLTYCEGGEQWLYEKPCEKEGMPSPVVTFPGVFDVMKDKALARANRHAESYLLAEGLIDGKVVATHKVTPSRRPTKLLLWLDDERVAMTADGSDLVTVVAAVADGNGVIKRLNNYHIRFEIEGPAELVGDAETYTNPRPVQWGTAPILVRASTEAGVVKVRALVTFEGKHTLLSGELEFTTRPADHPMVAAASELENLSRQRGGDSRVGQSASSADEAETKALRQELNRLRLKEVEQQQSDFE